MKDGVAELNDSVHRRKRSSHVRDDEPLLAAGVNEDARVGGVERLRRPDLFPFTCPEDDARVGVVANGEDAEEGKPRSAPLSSLREEKRHSLVGHLQCQIQRPPISSSLVDLSSAHDRLTESSVGQDVAEAVGEHRLRLTNHSERRLNLRSSDNTIVPRPVDGRNGRGVAIASGAKGEETGGGVGEACRCGQAGGGRQGGCGYDRCGGRRVCCRGGGRATGQRGSSAKTSGEILTRGSHWSGRRRYEGVRWGCRHEGVAWRGAAEAAAGRGGGRQCRCEPPVDQLTFIGRV